MKLLLSVLCFFSFFTCASDKDIGTPLGPDPDRDIGAEFVAWWKETFEDPPKPVVWFEEKSPTEFQLNWKSKPVGAVKTYDCGLREAWILTHLVRDKVYDGIDQLNIGSKEQFGPHKQRAVSMAVAGNRKECACFLLANGHGDDILLDLWNAAHENIFVEMQHIVVKRMVAIGYDRGKSDA